MNVPPSLPPGGATSVAGAAPPPVFHALPLEYSSIRSHAAVADRSDRFRMTLTGEKGAEVLTGLVTNDVLALSAGHGCYAAALTPKGKIIADVRIFSRGNDLLLDTSPRSGPGFLSMVRKFVNPRLAKYADITSQSCELVVTGPKCHDPLRRVFGEEVSEAFTFSAYGHLSLETTHGTVTIARVPDVGVEAYSIFAPAESRETLRHALIDAGARAVTSPTLAVARIEAGRPEWGVEIDESTIPQEANFDELQAISYTKGCYTGQETVARVHFRGHVNRHLRGLRFDSSIEVRPRALLIDADGKTVGEVRSVAHSPRLGGIALAMVRREVAMESEMLAQTDESEMIVRVVALPFPHS